MDADLLFERYRELQAYVGWTEADAARINAVADQVEPHLSQLVDDFYEEITRHPDARKVITGGQPQIERLKGTLIVWVRELMRGPYDRDHVAKRWRIGWRHVEIGLDQVYTNVALSRLRSGIVRVIQQYWRGPVSESIEMIESLHKLIDLDLAIIEDAYQCEHLKRQAQVERLAAVGHMAGGVAHELRQPLNVIRSSVYYLQHARNPTPEKTGEHLERIDRQVKLADGVITAMADFAKLPSPRTEPVNVSQCIMETLETIRLPDSIELNVDCPATALMQADASQLRIVLGNLIRNARDAMRDGGRLTIDVSALGEHVEITVSDTGGGIPPELLPRIMEPMFTTKARGIGLGLTISRAIVTKHGGHIRVHSEVGGGSTFTVVIPSAAAKPSDTGATQP
ncbi:MAG: protoglobin domain-containing protein [Phycisphaeraceae bacterium]